MKDNIERFRDCFRRGGFELHFIWDGVEETVKMDVHKTRYIRRIGEIKYVSMCELLRFLIDEGLHCQASRPMAADR